MSDAKQAWDDVGAKLAGLGRTLKQRLDDERRAEAGSTGAGADADDAAREEAGRRLRDVLDQLTTSLDEAFDALGAAAKDPEVREEATEAGRSLVGAIGTSLEELGDEVRRLMDRKRGGGPKG